MLPASLALCTYSTASQMLHSAYLTLNARYTERNNKSGLSQLWANEAGGFVGCKIKPQSLKQIIDCNLKEGINSELKIKHLKVSTHLIKNTNVPFKSYYLSFIQKVE